MQIQRNSGYSQNFQALHVANCGKLKLYEINSNADLKFLKALPLNIDTQNLMPNLSKSEYKRWNEMLEYAVDKAQNPNSKTYIETLNNKICGIITFNPSSTTTLECICTWPIKFGEKVKLAGQTLFYQVFKDFQSIKGKKIKLDAIIDGPYNTVQKYSKLGFKETTNMKPTKVEMEISAPKVKDKIKEMQSYIQYKKADGENINLFETVELP